MSRCLFLWRYEYFPRVTACRVWCEQREIFCLIVWTERQCNQEGSIKTACEFAFWWFLSGILDWFRSRLFLMWWPTVRSIMRLIVSLMQMKHLEGYTHVQNKRRIDLHAQAWKEQTCLLCNPTRKHSIIAERSLCYLPENAHLPSFSCFCHLQNLFGRAPVFMTKRRTRAKNYLTTTREQFIAWWNPYLQFWSSFPTIFCWREQPVILLIITAWSHMLHGWRCSLILLTDEEKQILCWAKFSSAPACFWFYWLFFSNSLLLCRGDHVGHVQFLRHTQE